MQADDEPLRFIPDEPPAPAAAVPVWKLLVVDDDEEVHEATRFALQNVRIHERPLQLISARSAVEAAAILSREPGIAVVLLDVVMESPDAGLRLVRRIRQELGLTELRIILRTGQPGHAPELQVIRDYDINDYKTKAELTHTRLVTALIVAIRSFEQLRAINENRHGLALINQAAAALIQAQSVERFAAEALTPLARLLQLPAEGLFCSRDAPSPDRRESGMVRIAAATGRYAPWAGSPLAQLTEADAIAAVIDCLAQGRHHFGPRHTVLHLRSQRREAALLIRGKAAVSPVGHQLLDLFAASASACFDSVVLVERLHFAAYHDPLTRLPNRLGFLGLLGRIDQQALAGQLVCLLDIDRFTDINNTLGHVIGDQLLIAVAQRLTEACRGCRVARTGSDAFGLVGPAEQLAPERLLALMQEPFPAGEQQLQIGATLGYCRSDGQAAGDALFQRADIALTQARLNPNVKQLFFTPEMEQRTHWRLDVIRALRRDFRERRLSVWFQPQVSLKDGSLVGLEALARWPDGRPEGRQDFAQPPGVFIPLAEEAGLIVDIGAWVLEQSCAIFRQLRNAGHPLQHVAVNVSMPQMRLMDFPERVMHVLARHHLPPSCLELEVTESIMLEEPLVVLRNLQALKQQGVHISIDDFGTGYSSLGYLRQMPIDCVKIDRSFVLEIDNGRGDLFAETVIALAHKLGAVTVAEGVDTPVQLQRLRQLGCDLVQGFLCAKPMPAEELERWIAAGTPIPLS